MIGDGALTAGMAFEALNHAGDVGTDLVVIINDNEMSISPNVGALSAHLTRLRMDKTLRRARSDIEIDDQKDPGDRRSDGQVGGAPQRLRSSTW